jgi:hypothetical protein
MTIEQMRERKKQAEQRIAGEINAFMLDTGLTVSEVYTGFLDVSHYGKDGQIVKRFVPHVKLEVEL